MKKLLFFCLIIWSSASYAQLFVYNSGSIEQVIAPSGKSYKASKVAFVSFRLNNNIFFTNQKEGDETFTLSYTHHEQRGESPHKVTFRIKNTSNSDTLTIENVVPFGESPNHTYITGLGDHRLSRSALFRPGYGPIGVILPDNAWELGFGVLQLDETNAVAGLARRRSWEKAEKKRFETLLYPGGEITYDLWYLPYSGDWQEGLRLMFQKHYLFDLEQFDNALFERADLAWIRKSYAINLMMAWDKDFYNPRYGIYYLPKTLEKAKTLIGGWDVVGIWPTWPALGLDQRNQWDMFRDLPGGSKELRRLSDQSHTLGTRLFLCYNPWDESTKSSTLSSQLQGMTAMLKETNTDGVVLDTRGSSSQQIQAAGDSAKSGVVMYSEGMAVPKDMPGIIAGRVHNALVYPPLLNLNKFIKPDFAIFRVAELAYEPILREYNLCLFNGHGVEINQFQPGRPEWIDEQYRHLGRILRVLRENSENFNYSTYTPLVASLKDSVYVNEWKSDSKTLYTVYNALPEGYSGALFPLRVPEGFHAVDLWNHEETKIESGLAVVSLEAFAKKHLGTNNEGTVGAIAVFPQLLKVSYKNDDLAIQSPPGKIRIWLSTPSYENKPLELEGGIHKLSLRRTLGWHDGKVIVQYLTGDELADEVVFRLKATEPRLISKVSRTDSALRVPGTIKIPGGTYRCSVDAREGEFMPYPNQPAVDTLMHSFWMEQFPVTNAQFFDFLQASCYVPNDNTNFLKHWVGMKPKPGEEDFPVVYVSVEDARAYAEWKGMRLPTEIEWQYAAQAGNAANLWPWGEEMDSTRTNRGDGIPYLIGQFPEGRNSLGIEDLVGNVWQLTNDVYFNGTNEYVIIKGGSYFNPTSSWWYVPGGPRPLTWRQMLLKIAQGFERSATVGFRCVKD